MEITVKTNGMMTFDDLKTGNVFLYFNTMKYYMKTTESRDFNAVCLNDGRLTNFCDDTSVINVNAELLIQ